MSGLVIALIVIGIASLIVASVTLVSMYRRRAVLRRATAEAEVRVESVPLLPEPDQTSFASSIARYVPASADNPGTRQKLLRGGIDSPTAPHMYYLLRVVSLAVFTGLGVLLAPKTSAALHFLAIALGVYLGLVAPMAIVDRMIRKRQERITRSVPDALDLLVVCVEAGISLDAAILRVSRELRLLHPELAEELAVVNRVTNAGVTRERALRGLWDRTGVQELRTIASSMVQSEKLGTSIATVLRVSSDTLRMKRRQAAEKRAKQAPLKMTFPLLFFILPALFIVVLGPAIFVVIAELGKI